MFSTICTHEEPTPQTPLTPRQVNGEPGILVVDDDSRIRRLICTLLKRTMTARVNEAADPYEALSMARETGAGIDLLICDINLHAPLDGFDVAWALAVANPRMKVLLMSAADQTPRKMADSWRFLAKPFAIESFLDCVCTLLGEAVRPRSLPYQRDPLPES